MNIRAHVTLTLMLAALAAAGGVNAQHTGHHAMHSMQTASSQPTEAGQSAFAAIQEVVAILEADPDTDWSTVNIDPLRDHLIDMNHVMLSAKVQSEIIEGGARYQVKGSAEVTGSIKRMVTAHARQVSTDTGWQAVTAETVDGVTLTVTSGVASDVVKIRALGFAGFMVQGNHHQPHHLMMAKSASGHQH